MLANTPLTLADPSFWGVTPTHRSMTQSMSADGQLVVFQSDADNIVLNDTNNSRDAFLFNRSTGTTSLLSVGTNGKAAGYVGPGGGDDQFGHTELVISPDGRYAAFRSTASNLVPGVSGDHIYLRDLQTQTTSVVDMNSAGTGAGNGSVASYGSLLFSADSRHILFDSYSTNLVAGFVNGPGFHANTFLRDLVAGTNYLIGAGQNGEGVGTVDAPALSADGRFVAYGTDEALVASDTNDKTDVYRTDVLTGISTLVSVNPDGTTSGDIYGDPYPSISADGRFIAFNSDAENLVATEDYSYGLYVRDMVAGTTTLATVRADGTTGDYGGVFDRSILSASGRYLAFVSHEDGLDARDTNGTADIFVRDLWAGTTTLVSVNAAGTNGGNAESGDQNPNSGTIPVAYVMAFSPDGRYLVFMSQATDLVNGVTYSTQDPRYPDLFLRDLVAGTTTLVTADPTGTSGAAGPYDINVDNAPRPNISSDGRFIAFNSLATNLVADTNVWNHNILVRDMLADTTQVASAVNPVLPQSFTAQEGGLLRSVTPDGRYVSFMGYASTSLLIEDGTYLSGNQLVPDIATASYDYHLYVRDRQTGTLQVIDVRPDGTTTGDSYSTYAPRLSDDGQFATFTDATASSYDEGLDPSVTSLNENGPNVYQRDLQAGQTRMISVDPSGTNSGNAASGQEIAASSSGRYVAFTSDASNLVTGMTNSHQGIYLRDTVNNTTQLVTINTAGTGSGNGDSSSISITPDGRYVQFSSYASDLVPNDTNNSSDVFRWDRTTGTISLVSVSTTAGVPGNGGSGDPGWPVGNPPVMSPDGNLVVFRSSASNIVAGVSGTQIYVRNILAGTTTLVSADTGGGGGNGTSSYPSLTSDGTKVAFLSSSTDLVSGIASSGNQVFVRDLTAGTTTLVSIDTSGTAGGNTASGPTATNDSPRISPDGRYVAFRSTATNLVAGYVRGSGSSSDLYLRDLVTGETRLITTNRSGTAGGAGGSGYLSEFQFTADGSTLFFDSNATDLIPGDYNYTTDVFATPTAGTSSISGQVFSDTNGDGVHDGGEAGLPDWNVFLDTNTNGQLDAGEQRAITDTSGNYAFQGLTIGSYTVAVVPQANAVQTLPISPNTYPVNIVADGTAITGQDFGEGPTLPDLTASGVTAPANVEPGEPITVSWTVTNNGTGQAPGGWQDAVYLSPTPTLAPDAILLTTITHFEPLAPGASYPGNATVDVPIDITQGTYYVVVRTDRRTQLPDPNTADNLAATATPTTLAVPINPLTLGVPTNDQFSGPYKDRYYEVSVSTYDALVVKLSDAPPGTYNEIFVSRGQLPTLFDHDYAATDSNKANPLLILPQTFPGTYYIMVHNRYGIPGQTGPISFTITPSQPGFSIQAIERSSGGNTGQVTIPIRGTSFTRDTQANLILGGNTINATAVQFVEPRLIHATFDLTGQAPGTYDVQVQDGVQSSTLPTAFDVVPGVNHFSMQLIVPPASRYGRDNRITILYSNDGNTDLPAPILQVASDAALLRTKDQQVYQGSNVQVLAGNPSGPAGILSAGTTGQIDVYFTATTTVPGGAINFTLSRVEDLTQTIDWAGLKSSLRPTWITPEAWDAVYANLTAVFGTTAGQFQNVLDDDANYLSSIGERVTDVSRLFAYEISKANGFMPSGSIASSVDVSSPQTGLPLVFTRRFNQPISERYKTGTLGRGWTTNWDISASVDAQGNVTILNGGSTRFFAKKRDEYEGATGDHATLTLTSGIYELTEPTGEITAFNLDGTLNYIQDANGNRITAGFTGGLLTSLTHSVTNDQLLLSYTNGRLTQITDPSGRIYTYGYDAGNEHLTSYTDKYGTTQYTYVTGQGLAREHALEQVTYSNNTNDFYSYDSLGRLINQHGDNGQEDITFSYGLGGGYTVTDAIGGTTEMLLDDKGHARQVIDPLGFSTQLTYCGCGNIIQAVLPDGSVYSHTYDSEGNLTETVDPLGNHISYTYDSTFNKLLSYTDARNNTTSYGYDTDGNLLNITYPGGNQQEFTYDPLGNLTDSLNRRGQAMHYTYDSHGLVTQKTYPDTSTVDYTYDSRGNMLTATDSDGTTTLDYDPATDSITKITYPNGNFLQFTYNSVAQRTQSVDQDGFTVNYNYDANGRLQQLTDGSSNLIVSYTYDDARRLTQKDLGNGTRTTYQYDAAGRLLQLVNLAPDHVTVNSSFDYTRDAMGRITQMVSQDGTTNYGYDALGQLTHVTLPGGSTIDYTYDAAGNRVSVVDSSLGTTNYTTNNLNQYTQVGTATNTFDDDGNLVSTTDGVLTTTYTYNPENRLTGVSSSTGDTWTYQYDPFGNRVATTENGQTTTNMVDPLGFGNVIAQYDNGGSLIAHYTHGLGLTSRTDAGGNAGYYDFNHIGSTMGITNAVGSYVNQYSYLPFGQTMTISAAVSNPFTFVGGAGVMDDGNGTINMRLRNYDPATGQFLSTDPLGVAAGDTNIRRYVGNDPIGSIDPLGLQPDTLGGVIGTIISGTGDVFNALGRNPLVTAFGKEIAREWQKDIVEPCSKFHFPTLEEVGNAIVQGLGYKPAPTLSRGPGDAPNANGGATGQSCTDPGPDGEDPEPDGEVGDEDTSTNFMPGDPNEIVGPKGLGAQHYIDITEPMPYTIHFENDPEIANAPAQEIFITETLAPNLDWTTFEFGDISFFNETVTVPAGLQSFHTVVDTENQDGSPLLVDIKAKLNLQTGVVTWAFTSLDPATGELPEDVFAGLLPVNNDDGDGQGMVNYTIYAKPNLATGATIYANAAIVFDVNPPIFTNTYVNTVGPPPGPISNVLTLRRNGSNLELYDNLAQSMVLTQAISDTTPIDIPGHALQHDTLTIDFASGGTFTTAAPINFNGGNGGTDTITVIGDETSSGSFVSGTAGSGTFNIGGTTINVSGGVGAATVSDLNDFTFNTTGGNDSLTVSNPVAGQSQISGTSGGNVLAPLTFFGIASVTLDTATNDTTVTTDSITLSVPLNASGLQNLAVSGGAGADTLTVPVAALALPVGGGTFTFDGGADTDRVVASGDVSMTLTDSSLVAGAATLALNSVEAASLIGGANANVFNASAFTGDTEFTGNAGNDTFTGGAGTDTIVESGNVNFTLTNTTLTGLGTDTFTSIEKARLTGGIGNNTINAAAFAGAVVLDGGAGTDKLTGGAGNDTLTGGAGTNTLIGGGGMDTVAETADVNYTLTNTKLTGPGIDTLSGIEQVNLTGGAGNNNFTVTGVTLPTTLNGGGGVDRVTSSADANFTVIDTTLTLSTGSTFALNSIEEASLTGGASNNTLDASAFSGKAILSGGAGNDTLAGGVGNDTLTGGLGDDTLDGGAGVNTVSDVGNVNFTLTNTTLTGLGTDSLTNITKAAIAGGSAANTLNASAFTGEVSLTGGTGSDTLIGGSGINHVVESGVAAATLLDGQLKIGSAIDTLVGITDAILTGTTSANTFTVSGWTGTATLNGGTGTDKVIAVNDANFALTNTSLTRSTGGTFTLNGIESTTLTGGVSANTFDVSGWTGTATVTGGGGADQLISNNNAGNVTLTNTTVTRTLGGTLTLSAIPNVTVGGDSSANVFTVSGRTTGSTTVTGGATDRVVSAASGNATLTNSVLSRTVGTTTITYDLSGIGQATLVGGTGNDTLDATAFSGNVTFTGGAGNDALLGGTGTNTVAETGNVNFLLTDTQLTGLGTDTLSNITLAVLTGGTGANTLDASAFSGNVTLTGGTGNDVLRGGSGTNVVVETGNVNLTLSGDTFFATLTGLGSDTLFDIAEVRLTGGNSANSLNASGYSGNTILDGGSGNDTLTGGSGFNVLVGNVGNDKLYAGVGPDVLIGGVGIDQLIGGFGDNLLIGGTVNYGVTSAAFQSIVAEWTSGNSYSQRVAFLRSGGGLNGSDVLSATTAPNDSAVDTLTGGLGTDWFLVNLPQDIITDLVAPEVTN